MKMFVIANKFTSAKTLTSYYLAKYLFSKNKKILILNFSEDSIFKKLFKYWKKFYLSNFQNKSNINANIMKGKQFDLINIFSNIESQSLSEEDIYNKLNNLVEIISESYEIVIVDLTSTDSFLNKYFMKKNIYILVPIVLNSENQIEYFTGMLHESHLCNSKIFFFISSFDKSNNNHIFNLIKYRKYLTSFLLKNLISFFETNDKTLIFNKKEVENEYKNIFKELKIV